MFAFLFFVSAQAAYVPVITNSDTVSILFYPNTPSSHLQTVNLDEGIITSSLSPNLRNASMALVLGVGCHLSNAVSQWTFYPNPTFHRVMFVILYESHCVCYLSIAA